MIALSMAEEMARAFARLVSCHCNKQVVDGVLLIDGKPVERLRQGDPREIHSPQRIAALGAK